MRPPILLAILAQYATWTDSEGVVHVAAITEAPRSARPIEGDTFSVIDLDSRPLVLTDGGTRAADSGWWRERFRVARAELERTSALERAAQQAVSAANRRVCVTATARAVARVPPRLTRAGRLEQGAANEVTERETKCETSSPSASQRAEVELRGAERRAAELALRALEVEANLAQVPLRDR